ncbi:MAG: BamA/TamA family outer membrane protein [Pseudomonadales bacterium]|nr:BamA/TamA family outer membrane protein [Pseudomonadales bacterium]
MKHLTFIGLVGCISLCWLNLSIANQSTANQSASNQNAANQLYSRENPSKENTTQQSHYIVLASYNSETAANSFIQSTIQPGTQHKQQTQPSGKTDVNNDRRQKLQQQWQTEYPAATMQILPTLIDEHEHYRVAIGPIKNHQQAAQVRDQLKQTGHKAAWISSEASIADNQHRNNESHNKSHNNQPAAQPTIQPVAPAKSPMLAMAQSSATMPATNNISPAAIDQQRISQLDELRLDNIIVESSILQPEIVELVDYYLERRITVADLLQLKNSINQLFVFNGYINSGVLIPDQQIIDGTLKFKVIEGNVSQLNIDSKLRDKYINARISISKPFNLTALQNSLKLLEQDPLIDRIDAKVSPGAQLGQADLSLAVDTQPRFRFGLRLANDRAPSIGSENAEFSFSANNLTGWGDSLYIKTGITDGLNTEDYRLTIPFSHLNHSLSLFYSISDSAVTEAPFDDIDVESKTESFGINLDIPLKKTLRSALAIHFTFESRKNQTSLLGQNFSFSEGAINGQSRVSPYRIAISYSRQSTNQAFAGRLSISKGSHYFDATKNTGQADGNFTSYLGQAQYSRQLSETNYLTARLVAQYASDALLSVEKFSLGGLNSVRGYRENQVVRDKAYFASVELRHHLPSVENLELIGFIDWGLGENHSKAVAQGKDSIHSAGFGISYQAMGLQTALYYAHGFKNFDTQKRNLQDQGIHFEMAYHYVF